MKHLKRLKNQEKQPLKLSNFSKHSLFEGLLLATMNKYASFALAFLLVFSGCLGGSDNDLTTEDNTVEPVGETDFTSLEKDLENLTTKINAEIRLDNLETLVEGIDDSEDTLNALGCEEDEIAAYDGMEWRCAHVQQFLPPLDEAIFISVFEK